MLNYQTSFRPGGNWFKIQPIAVRAILLVTVISFFIQLVIPQWISWFQYVPDLFTVITQPWRLVSYLFLHGGGWHLLFNMLWFYWMGRQIEIEVGPRSLSSIYFLSGIGGAIINLLLTPLVGANPVIGASGAVYGVMVAFAVFHPNAPIMLFLLPPLPTKYVVYGLIAFDLFLIGEKSNVARIVHLGGALTGYLLAQSLVKGKKISGWIDFLMYYVSRFASFANSEVQHTQQKSARKKSEKKRNSRMSAVQDAEIVKEINQSELDSILDKIAKSGYEALSAEEKRILFEMSKKK